ncbi:MAG: 50S ribosomal protein L15 [Candidatus Omnitrophica bacterium]|nr:50S ribosomal protein L15 [Candidatus Omnitrophota bacterium]
MKSKKTVKKSKSQDSAQLVGLFNLKVPAGAHKGRKYLGRGSSSGHGKTSTRGSKGQTSRAGRHFYLGFEGGQSPLVRKMPKRGFNSVFKKEYQIVNLESLAKIKETVINPELLLAKGLIKDKRKPVKILGDGCVKNAITVQAHSFSKKASEEIKKAGGVAEVINV